jgi:hypothetical protein
MLLGFCRLLLGANHRYRAAAKKMAHCRSQYPVRGRVVLGGPDHHHVHLILFHQIGQPLVGDADQDHGFAFQIRMSATGKKKAQFFAIVFLLLPDAGRYIFVQVIESIWKIGYGLANGLHIALLNDPRQDQVAGSDNGQIGGIGCYVVGLR